MMRIALSGTSKYSTPCDKCIGASGGNISNIFDFDTAVHFQPNLQTAVVYELSRLPQFPERRGDKGLAAKTRVN